MKRERSIDIDTSHLDRIKPLGVDVGDFKSFEAAVKKFRKIVEKEGIIRQVLDKKFYKKLLRSVLFASLVVLLGAAFALAEMKSRRPSPSFSPT